MKHLLIIILPIFLLTSPLFGQETGVLYQFKNSSGFVWKTFGKAKVQPKYEGEVSNGTPEGFGVLSYPFTHGKTVVGEWKVGKEWYTEHYNKDGTLIGKYVNGKW
ncbi:MAG TPA: MORN motif-containing protein, partial [Deltaproteobacteria bacterium]|nr:MORN motif-containing protein [Deltaproteobacteria bacterium]